jgi:hypothetical protein
MTTKSIPPCHPHTGDSYFDSLLEPSRFYAHPNNVLVDQRLSPSEKRAVLASWASDECAVDSMPTLRIAPWSPTAVTFDDVMEALQKLDRETDRQSLTKSKRKRGVDGGSNASV